MKRCAGDGLALHGADSHAASKRPLRHTHDIGALEWLHVNAPSGTVRAIARPCELLTMLLKDAYKRFHHLHGMGCAGTIGLFSRI